MGFGKVHYTLPRTRLLRWLVSSPGAEDEQKQSWLLANMFTRTMSLVGGAVSELIVAVTATVMHPTIPVVAWLCAGTLLLLWRVHIIYAARRRTAQRESTSCGTFVVSSLAWALELGIGNMLCTLSGEPVLQILSNACVFPIVAGISARNTNTPRLALAQMLIAMSLVAAGAALSPQLWIKVLIIQMPFFLIGLGSICLRSGRDLVSMLDAQHRNAALARHDSLTQLPNRVLMHERLEGLLASNVSNQCFALVLMDLDGFKAINDALGHAAGDAVLVETAQRLLSISAESDRLAARLGGDEFLLLLPRASQNDAAVLAATIAAAIRRPYALLNAPDIRLDASIGIALYPEHGGDADTLLAAADKALYAVKATGKARMEVYDPLLHAGDADIVLLRSELARTLSKDRGTNDGELELYYQPVTRLSDGTLVGREALVRWQHPLRGLVSPGTFIPLAEASGLIIPLGEWVLRHACSDATRWSDGAKVAVNVSPFQLRCEHFMDVVGQALEQAGLPPGRLEVEVTETVLLSRDAVTTGNMHKLRALGVKVVLDDFGTGFSSLSNLCSFVFDRIKIDGSFIREALIRRDCAAVVHATVELARHLGVPTTAECVETEAQLEFVHTCGCDEVQGYLLGRPVPASSVPAYDAPSRMADGLRPDRLVA
ncbi:MAG: putative bifunctional diguanylate cyclase/phosphodiesterase [Janthinobacterium lividum]